jgi:hypothetical protein
MIFLDLHRPGNFFAVTSGEAEERRRCKGIGGCAGPRLHLSAHVDGTSVVLSNS